MDSLEIIQNISILNAHAIEIDELALELSEHPVERGQALLEVVFIEFHFVDRVDLIEDVRQTQRLALYHGSRVGHAAVLEQVDEHAGVKSVIVGF